MPKYHYKVTKRYWCSIGPHPVVYVFTVERYELSLLLFRKNVLETKWYRYSQDKWCTTDDRRADDVYIGKDTYGYHLYLDEFLEGDLHLNYDKLLRPHPPGGLI